MMQELIQLHRPMVAVEGDLEESCPDCHGGMFAHDPWASRPCGCWGPLPPVCGTCAVRGRGGDYKLRHAPWPCETARAIGCEWWVDRPAEGYEDWIDHGGEG